jgi:hypothetical protein
MFTHLLALAAHRPGTLATMRNYVRKWVGRLKSGLVTLKQFEQNVQTLKPAHLFVLDASNPWFFNRRFLSIILILVHKTNMKTRDTQTDQPRRHKLDLPRRSFFPILK